MIAESRSSASEAANPPSFSVPLSFPPGIGAVVLGTKRSRSGNLGEDRANVDRPNLVPGRDPNSISKGTSAGCLGVPAGMKLGTPEHFLDPCAFTIQPAGFLGNLGRNYLRRPGLYNLDFALAKDTSLSFLGEGGKLEFRADMFNLLNHTNFQLVKETRLFTARQNVEAPIAGAGQITNTSTKSRQVQLSLRVEF